MSPAADDPAGAPPRDVPPPPEAPPLLGVPALPPERPPTPPRPIQVSALMLWLPALTFVGFALILGALIVIQGQRSDQQDLAIGRTQAALQQQLTEQREKLIRMDSTLEARSVIVELIPGMLTTLQALQQQVAALDATVKISHAQTQLHTQDLTRYYQDMTAIRHDLELLSTRVNDLTYVRQPKTPIEEPSP